LNPVLYLIPLLLVVSVPTAFAQIVETEGQNYDLREDYFIGEAIWNSHPERIMDNGWKNYALSNTGEKVIFNTNSIGSLVYDKNSCSYSIYENGYNGDQVIPSVSAVASYLDNGVWSNLPVNDEACTVTVQEYNDGVFLTSTKVITDTISEDVFISYTGTDELFYANSTNSAFTLQKHINGTNIGYFNGEVTITEGAVIDKFVQELRLDINKGFKETFKVWHDGTEELGISQTVHTGESITIGENTINIAQLNGQSFDRQYIEDNQAEILQLTDSVNYDFDTGIESLTNVNIIFDGNYKVNLDYASGNFVGYLEIDPTFGYTDSTIGSEYSGYDACTTWDSGTGDAWGANTAWIGSNAHFCYLSWAYWDISSIDDGVSISDIDIRYDVDTLVTTAGNFACDIAIYDNGDLSGETGSTKWTNIPLGTKIVDDWDCDAETVADDYTMDLGTTAEADFETDLQIGDDEWGIGFMKDPYNTQGLRNLDLDNIELQVTYSFPVAPQPPTGLTTTTGIPIELDWTAPTDNGGSAITGYKVFRSDSEFAQVELPNSSGSDSQLTFTDNEFLLHGLVSTTTLNCEISDICIDEATQTLADASWIPDDTAYIQADITNDEIDFDSTGYSHSYEPMGIVHDIGYHLDSSDWVIQYKLDITSHQGESTGGKSNYVGIGISSIDNNIAQSTEDSGNLFRHLFIHDGGSAQTQFQSKGSGTWLNGVDYSSMSYTPTVNTLYVEMINNGGSITSTLYEDDTYSTQESGTSTVTFTKNFSDLQYFYILLRQDSGGNGHDVGTVSDINIWNGVNVAGDITSTTTTLADKSTNSVPVTSGAVTTLGGTVGEIILTPDRACGVERYDENNTCGARFTTSSSSSGITFDTIEVEMYKSSSSASGTLHAYVVDNSWTRDKPASSILYDMGTLSISSITETCTSGTVACAGITHAKYQFSGSGTYTLSSSGGDESVIIFSDHNNSGFHIGIDGSDSDDFDGINTHKMNVWGSQGNYYTNGRDTAIKFLGDSITYPLPTSITGSIGTALQNPNLIFADTDLPDNTDTFSLGGYVKLDAELPISDFTGTWTTSGSKVTTSSGTVTATLDGSSQDSYATFDLGSALSDTWVLRYKQEATTNNFVLNSGNAGVLMVGLSNTESISGEHGGASAETLYQRLRHISGAWNMDGFDIRSRDGSTTTAGGNSGSALSTGAQTYYVELIKDGANSSVKYFSDASFTSQVGGTQTVDATGSGSSLQYLGIHVFSESYSSGSLVVEASEFKIYNGVTSPDDLPIPTGKLLGLNDVTFNVGTTTASVTTPATATIDDNFSTNNYSVTGSNIAVTNNEIQYSTSSDDSRLYRTITDIGNQDFVIDWVETIGTYSSSGHVYNGVIVAEDNTRVYASSANDGYTSRTITKPTSSYCPTNDCSVISPQSSIGGTKVTGSESTSFVTHGDTYYMRLSLDGTTLRQEAFSDEARTVSVAFDTITTSAIPNLVSLQHGSQTTGSTVSGVVIDDVKVYYNMATTDPSTIISATGLTDNTSTPQHYAITRDSSNLWTIYQNGVSKSTVTDATSLGSNGVRDSSLDGTNNGATTGQTGKLSNAWNFDGSNDYVDTPSKFNFLHDTTGGSLSYWVSHDSISSMPLMVTGDQSTHTGMYIRNDAGNKLRYCVLEDGNVWSCQNTTANVSTGTWYHVVHTIGTTINTYINGNLDSSFTPTNPRTADATNNFRFGQDYSGNHWNGKLDQVIIYDKVLSTSEISALYNSGSGTSTPDTTNMKAHYDFEQTGSTLENKATVSSDYTTNLSGSLDEFFINSDTLTSTEIENISDRGETLTAIATTGASTTDYDDSSVTGGNDYYYSVKTTNAIGDSNFLTPFVSGLAGSPAQVPTSVATATNSPNSDPLDVTVSWSAPTDVGTGTLTGFEIYRDGTLLTTVGLVTSHIDTTPNSGTYVYSLKSLATHGNSGFSATSSIDTPTAPPTPNAPTLGITSPNPSPFDVTISWTAQSNGGSAITSTEIFRSTTETGTYTSVGTVTDLDFTDTVPSAGTWYYKIASTNLLGSSAQGTSANIATPTVPSSDSSTTLAINNPNPSPRDITVSLVAPSSDGGSSVTGYNIYSSDDNVTFNSVASAVTTDTTITVATGGTWYFKSEAINNVGTANQGSSVSITTPTVPTASGVTLSIPSPDPSPLDIVAVFTAPSSDGGSSVTGYNLLSSPDDSVYNYVAQAVTADQTITVANTGTWYFKSQAINNVGNGTLSSAVSITTATVPDAPSITLAINNPDPSPLEVTTTFTTPSNNGGSSVTGFNLYHSSDGSLYTSVASAVNGNYNYTVSNSGTQYFKSEAISNAGTSNNSTAVTIATPNAPDASSVLLNIDNPNPSPFDITASFVAPSSDGGSAITAYNLLSSFDDVTYDYVAQAVTANQTITVPNAGTWYFKSQAINNVGNGTLGSAVTIATPTVPDAPSITLAINSPNTNPFDITASFVAPSNNGGSSLIDYNLEYSSDDSTYVSLINSTTVPYTHTVSGAGTHYFKAEVTNNVGTSLLSSSYNIATPTVPTAPTNASVVIPNIDTASYDTTVTWSAPTSDGGSSLINYKIYRQTGSGSFSLIATTTQSVLTINDTVPTALNQSYTYKITALNNVGESTAFVTTTITTGDVPTAPILSGTTGTTVMTWTIPSSDATITGYKIYRDGNLMTTVTTANHSDFQTLVFGNTYVYTVKAVSVLGDSVASNIFTTTPETEITGMIAQGITGTGAVIDWDEPAYYQGQITSYEVYYSEVTASVTTPTTSAGTTTNTYSNFAPNLDYDTTYIFGVKVISPLGNSGFSNYVTVTTSVDGSIVAFDPTTGGMEWFDIDSVNDQTVNVIEFQRETQTINGTATDTLQVAYPSWWDDMTCDVDYKFAQKTEQYVEGEDMTSQINSADANQQVIGFAFQDIDNEVIEVECAPQQSTQDDGVSAKYVMTQNSLSTGLPNIPLVTQVTNFTAGEYGTDGDFGAIDVVGLFVILVSMVGFNRVSPIVGVLISASTIFALSFFGLIAIPTIIVGAIALVIFLAWGIHRKR